MVKGKFHLVKLTDCKDLFNIGLLGRMFEDHRTHLTHGKLSQTSQDLLVFLALVYVRSVVEVDEESEQRTHIARLQP